MDEGTGSRCNIAPRAQTHSLVERLVACMPRHGGPKFFTLACIPLSLIGGLKFATLTCNPLGHTRGRGESPTLA